MLEADDLRPRNSILRALGDEEWRSLLPKMEHVKLSLKDVLYTPDDPIPYVYFPYSGVISMLTIMADGSAVEIATVGNEGMVGIPVFLGAGAMPGQAFSQVPGEGMRMKSFLFREHIESGGQLHGLMHRYTQGLLNQIAQSAACNRLHSIEERCSRWLLMTHDRVGADRFPLTQEFLAQMLGVRRATVNMAARMLQQAGLIRYSRGTITILDRAGLEETSCECYMVIKTEFDRLLR